MLSESRAGASNFNLALTGKLPLAMLVPEPLDLPVPVAVSLKLNKLSPAAVALGRASESPTAVPVTPCQWS